MGRSIVFNSVDSLNGGTTAATEACCTILRSEVPDSYRPYPSAYPYYHNGYGRSSVGYNTPQAGHTHGGHATNYYGATTPHLPGYNTAGQGHVHGGYGAAVPSPSHGHVYGY